MSVLVANWDYHIDLINLESKLYRECSLKLTKIFQTSILIEFEERFKSNHVMYNGIGTESQDDYLKYLIENNKELRHEIEIKLEEVSQQQIQYEKFKQDQKHLSKEIKEKHEAFLMAKKYYKKFFKIYYTFESRTEENQIIYIQYFTEAKKDADNYSIRLQKNIKDGHYVLLSTTPSLPCLKDLQKNLQDTNDVPGALCFIREAFIEIKHKK